MFSWVGMIAVAMTMVAMMRAVDGKDVLWDAAFISKGGCEEVCVGQECCKHRQTWANDSEWEFKQDKCVHTTGSWDGGSFRSFQIATFISGPERLLSLTWYWDAQCSDPIQNASVNQCREHQCCRFLFERTPGGPSYQRTILINDTKYYSYGVGLGLAYGSCDSLTGSLLETLLFVALVYLVLGAIFCFALAALVFWCARNCNTQSLCAPPIRATDESAVPMVLV